MTPNQLAAIEPRTAVTMWTQTEAIELCKKIEAICPKFGCHVALTGGLLYKEGERKDCDILFYRIRQVELIDIDGLFVELEKQIGLAYVSGFDWCQKATYQGKNIDCLFPEGEGTEYLEQIQPNTGQTIAPAMAKAASEAIA